MIGFNANNDDLKYSRVIVLCGLPGSGKSTYITKNYPSWVRISQDELGNRDACIRAAAEALRVGKYVVIDRCNHTVKQRKYWIDLAHQYGASTKCVFLSVNPDECFHRINFRKNHPTISEYMPSSQKKDIVNKFFLELEIPTLGEGFLEVTHRRNDLDK